MLLENPLTAPLGTDFTPIIALLAVHALVILLFWGHRHDLCLREGNHRTACNDEDQVRDGRIESACMIT